MKQGNRTKISRPAYAKREADRQARAKDTRETEALNKIAKKGLLRFNV